MFLDIKSFKSFRKLCLPKFLYEFAIDDMSVKTFLIRKLYHPLYFFMFYVL